MKHFGVISALVISLTLLSCSESDNNSSSDNNRESISNSGAIKDYTDGVTYSEGFFVDAVVEGINYDTGSVSGVTNSSGSFLYQPGENVEFSVGNIILGSTKAKSLITPGDLSESGSTNIASFLISIDNDAFPDNGIQVVDNVNTAADQLSIQFNTNVDNFYSNENVNSIVQNLTNETSAGQRGLVTQSIVTEHLTSSNRAIIASHLFNIPISDIDNSTLGANYNYNPWQTADSSRDGSCLGYDGGHSGLDIQTKDVAGNTKTANRYFYSLSEGIVINTGSTDSGNNYGLIAVYDENNDRTVIYLHAKSISVQKDDIVSVGDELGIQGNTGLSSNPNMYEHVHVEVRSSRRTGPACGATTSIEPEMILVDYIKNKKEPDIQPNPITLTGHVYNNNDDPVTLAQISTSLDSSTALTDSSGYFNLVTFTEASGNYQNTPYTITVKTANYQGYSNLGSTRVWGETPSGLEFKLAKYENKPFSITYPVNNGSFDLNDGTFKWNSDSRADKYFIRVMKSGGRSIWEMPNIQGTSIVYDIDGSASEPLQTGTKYWVNLYSQKHDQIDYPNNKDYIQMTGDVAFTVR